MSDPQHRLLQWIIWRVILYVELEYGARTGRWWLNRGSEWHEEELCGSNNAAIGEFSLLDSIVSSLIA